VTVYGTGPITITHAEDYSSVNYGGTDYGIIPAPYLLGWDKPNFPVPAIPLIHQWDFSLWVLLETMPPMTDEEWEREEDEWQDYLDSLDEGRIEQ
jgi:hypothetical protein